MVLVLFVTSSCRVEYEIDWETQDRLRPLKRFKLFDSENEGDSDSDLSSDSSDSSVANSDSKDSKTSHANSDSEAEPEESNYSEANPNLVIFSVFFKGKYKGYFELDQGYDSEGYFVHLNRCRRLFLLVSKTSLNLNTKEIWEFRWHRQGKRYLKHKHIYTFDFNKVVNLSTILGGSKCLLSLNEVGVGSSSLLVYNFEVLD